MPSPCSAVPISAAFYFIWFLLREKHVTVVCLPGNPPASSGVPPPPYRHLLPPFIGMRQPANLPTATSLEIARRPEGQTSQLQSYPCPTCTPSACRRATPPTVRALSLAMLTTQALPRLWHSPSTAAMGIHGGSAEAHADTGVAASFSDVHAAAWATAGPQRYGRRGCGSRRPQRRQRRKQVRSQPACASPLSLPLLLFGLLLSAALILLGSLQDDTPLADFPASREPHLCISLLSVPLDCATTHLCLSRSSGQALVPQTP